MHLIITSPAATVSIHTGLLSSAPCLGLRRNTRICTITDTTAILAASFMLSIPCVRFYRTNSPAQRPTPGGLKPVANATTVYIRRLAVADGDVNGTLDAQINHAARLIKRSAGETVDVITRVQSISPDSVSGPSFRPAAMVRLLGVEARCGATFPTGLIHGFASLSLRKRMRLFRCGSLSLDLFIASTGGRAQGYANNGRGEKSSGVRESAMYPRALLIIFSQSQHTNGILSSTPGSSSLQGLSNGTGEKH